ncbi:MAG: hypothetical protein ACOYOU_09085 [Kiritimatiellia bacterium]
MERLHVDRVIPISDDDAYLVAYAHEKSGSRAFVTSSRKAIEIARSRKDTTELCQQLNIPVPVTVCVNRSTDIAGAAASLGFPCYLKISQTFASAGVFLVESIRQLNRIVQNLPPSAEVQLQKPIQGDFLGVTGFARDGQLLESFAFDVEYRFTHSGTPPYSICSGDRRAHEILAKICRALDWTGGIDLDMLHAADDALYLLEINPRFSGTLVFPFKLGVDLPACYLPARDGDCRMRAASKSSHHAFICVSQEIRFMRSPFLSRLREAVQFRLQHRCVNDLFWRDTPLMAAWLTYHVNKLFKVVGARLRAPPTERLARGSESENG